VVLTLFTKQPAIRLAPFAFLSVTFILCHERDEREGEKKEITKEEERTYITITRPV
jgi:hypothetical protein